MSDFFSSLVNRRTRDSSSEDPSTSASASLSIKSKQDRRRAQVRNAQRKHRERRESYINATASSVRALRDFNRRLMEENALLQAGARPGHVSAPGSDTDQPSNIPQYSQIDPQAQPFQFRLSPKPAFQTEVIEIRPMYGSDSDQHYMSDSGMSASLTPPPLLGPVGGEIPAVSLSAPTPAPPSTAGFGEGPHESLQQTLAFAGADFILGLEHPCMSHIHDLADPTGSHNHTMSHQILWSAPPSSHLSSSSASPSPGIFSTTSDARSDTPPYPQFQQPHQPQSQQQQLSQLPGILQDSPRAVTNPLDGDLHSWNAATATLDKLISLSACLALAHGEITPVQAWFKLMSHACFRLRCGGLVTDGTVNNVDPAALEQMLRELTEALKGEVRCYGFGAVVDEALFDSLLARLGGVA